MDNTTFATYETYYSFKKRFRTLCYSFVQRYQPEYDDNNQSFKCYVIREFKEKHKNARINNSTTLKALNELLKQPLLTVPEELLPIIKRLPHKRFGCHAFGGQALKELYGLYCKNPNIVSKYFNNIAAYYIIANDIINIKHWKRIAEIQLHAYELFKEDIPAFEIVMHYNLLKPVVQKIRFKNEWFAIYYALSDYVKPHSMRTFSRLMNLWYPNAAVSCSYDSIADYSFLLKADNSSLIDQLNNIKTKARLKGCIRIERLYNEEIIHLKYPKYHSFLI